MMSEVIVKISDIICKYSITDYLNTNLNPRHVSVSIVTSSSGPRKKKKTLQMGSLNHFKDMLIDSCVHDNKEVGEGLHRRALQQHSVGGSQKESWAQPLRHI